MLGTRPKIQITNIWRTNEKTRQRKEDEEKEYAKGTQAKRQAGDNTSWWQQLLLFPFVLQSHSITIVPSAACSFVQGEQYGGGALGDESLANNADFFHCANQATKRPSRGQQFLQEIFVLPFSLLPAMYVLPLAMQTELSLKSELEMCLWYNTVQI